MLYVTTRDQLETYTAHRALTQDRTADGGFYAPFRLPGFSTEEIARMTGKSFGDTMAQILNLFFSTNLTAAEVSFAVGRRPLRLKSLSHRIVFGELWHDPGMQWQWIARRLSRLVLSRHEMDCCTKWTQIAVRVGMVFDAYGHMCRDGIIQMGEVVDVSVLSGDFSSPMAVWYAREMGLPVGDIICCCHENNSLWELMHQGCFATGALATVTAIPEADVVVPDALEYLISACGDARDVGDYLDVCRKGAVYKPGEELLDLLRQGLDVRVLGADRISSTVRSVWRTYSYLTDPATAVGYAGLLDHRAGCATTRQALVLSPCAPASQLQRTADAMGISTAALEQLINQM